MTLEATICAQLYVSATFGFVNINIYGMNKATTEKEQMPDQLSDILLVLDKKKMKIQAVTGIGEDGELKTVDPTVKNQNQFMRIDKHGDFFSNFFANFLSQLKNPTRFAFFRAPESESVAAAKEIQKHLDNPSKEGAAILDTYKVIDPKVQNTENKNTMETPQATPETSEYRFKPEQIDWETMSNLGLSKERLEKMNLLVPLLKGHKTNDLVSISLNFGTAVTRMDARLSLQSGEDGMAVMAIHGIRKEPQLNFPFFGHEFSKEDKENLQKSGNMGRVVDLTNPKSGETIPSIVSVDKLTNELVALRVDRIKIPDEIKGVKLDDHQKQTLMEGKPLQLEGMISRKGTEFSATVQFNADKRYVEFLFDQTNTKRQAATQTQGQPHEAPRFFREKELDAEQYNKFKAGQTIYVSGLVDKKGKEYNGYITYDKETDKIGFSFSNPNKLKDKLQPTEKHQTQTAVNSEGKTNEATKHIKEPLKSGQENPDSNKQKEQQENATALTKPKRIRRSS